MEKALMFGQMAAPIAAICLILTVGWFLVTWLKIRNVYPLSDGWGRAVYPKSTDETVERVRLLTQENAQLRAEQMAGERIRRLALVHQHVDAREALAQEVVTDHVAGCVDQVRRRQAVDVKCFDGIDLDPHVVARVPAHASYVRTGYTRGRAGQCRWRRCGAWEARSAPRLRRSPHPGYIVPRPQDRSRDRSTRA